MINKNQDYEEDTNPDEEIQIPEFNDFHHREQKHQFSMMKVKNPDRYYNNYEQDNESEVNSNSNKINNLSNDSRQELSNSQISFKDGSIIDTPQTYNRKVIGRLSSKGKNIIFII